MLSPTHASWRTDSAQSPKHNNRYASGDSPPGPPVRHPSRRRHRTSAGAAAFAKASARSPADALPDNARAASVKSRSRIARPALSSSSFLFKCSQTAWVAQVSASSPADFGGSNANAAAAATAPSSSCNPRGPEGPSLK